MATSTGRDGILTIKDVAVYLKVTERTIYRLAAATRIPAFKVGGSWRFSREDIDSWIKQQSMGDRIQQERKWRKRVTASNLPTVLQMRLLVAFLGERAQCAWWPTAFYEASSRLFLEPVFSKTFRLAQYHGVLEAARRLHDEHLNVGSYHLFRLPEEAEQDLHGMLQDANGEELVNKLLQNKDAALDILKGLTTNVNSAKEGPTAVGSIKDLESGDVLNAIAGAYLSGFSKNTKIYPYLVG